MKSRTQRPGSSARPAAGLVLLIGSALIVGGLIAPPVFNGLILLGRTYAALEFLRELEFPRVLNRCVMIVALLGLVPALRWCGMGSRAALGMPRGARWARLFAMGWGLGCVSIGAVALAGLAVGAFGARPLATGEVLALALNGLVGAVLIGVVEEVFFRGLVFGSLRASMGLLGGLIVSNVVYALVHFARPSPPLGVVHVSWNSAFLLMRHAFHGSVLAEGFFPMVLTLFVIGLVLSILYHRMGNLYLVMGIHAGWVWIIELVDVLTTRTVDRLPLLFGPTTLISKSYASLVFAVAMLLVVLCFGRKRGRRRC